MQNSKAEISIPYYVLPTDRIAEFPLEERDASKLLTYQNGQIKDANFKDLPGELEPGSLLVLNNTRVIEARIFFHKPTGGVIEIFCLEPLEDMAIAMQRTKQVKWNCLIGGASKWKPGQVLEKKIVVNENTLILQARFIEKREGSFIIEFTWEGAVTFAAVLHSAGTIPLPPYIKRSSVDADRERYQTIFTRTPGSVAAPTASLHFTERVFSELEQKSIKRAYVTLNVGAGTFMPVKTDTLKEHPMHAEMFTVSRQALDQLISASSIVAAGTTTLRTLESLYWIAIKTRTDPSARFLDQWEAYELEDDLSYPDALRMLKEILNSSAESELKCSTKLLITPGYRFKSAEALITNFHQPGSTLLALVSAFVGEDWKKIYDHALSNDYRFLSYGDSSLLWRSPI